VISEPPQGLTTFRLFFRDLFPKACELGLASFAVSKDTATISKFRDWRDEAFQKMKAEEAQKDVTFEQWARPFTSSAEAAEAMARHQSGPPPNIGIKIDDLSGSLPPEVGQLLERAFGDCVYLTVVPLDGGRTARGVFRVFASLGDQEKGPHPMPFLVKAGSPKNTFDEMENYRERAEPFIPFHLRPSLSERRSILTPTYGLLVCNFVEGGASLPDTLRNNQGAGAVFSLFEVTLRALRSHAAQSAPRKHVVSTFLKERLKLHQLSSKRREIAANEFGIGRTPEAICAALIQLCDGLQSHSGVYHGDMHAGNVLVRQRDAIVIDFGSMRDTGPLTADPAVLETSLVFAPDDGDQNDQFDNWKKFAKALYPIDGDLNKSAIPPPIVGPEHLQFAWIRRAVREARHVVTCCGVNGLEANIVLVGALMRSARGYGYPEKHILHEYGERKRAYALAIADRLCEKLEADVTACKKSTASP